MKLSFEKIEDDVIEKQVNKLLETKKLNEAAKPIEVSKQKETIIFDDFVKMDIRTGKIIEAERVP